MFIRTDRLYLRPAWPEDARAVFAGIAEWDIIKNLSRVPWPYELRHAEEFVAFAPDPKGGNFLIFHRDEGALVGSIGFGYWFGEARDPEIGYWHARRFWGQGLAAEAGRAVLELAFEAFRYPRLGAGHFADNPNSGAVLRKLGFRATGETKLYPCLARGTEAESVEYLLTAEDWRSARQLRRKAA